MKQDGTSVNQPTVAAVAEKLPAMATGDQFAQRRTQVDVDAFDCIMNRDGGKRVGPTICSNCYGRNPVEIHGIVATSTSATTSTAIYGQMRPSASSLEDLAIRQVW